MRRPVSAPLAAPMAPEPAHRLLAPGLLALGVLGQGQAWGTALGLWSAWGAAGWTGALLAHAASAPLLALGAWLQLPPHLRTPRAQVLAVLLSLCLALPGLGPLTVLVAGPLLRRLQRPADADTRIQRLGLPAFDGNLGHASRLRVTGMAPQALRGTLPADKRLQALMSLQSLPSAASTALLRQAMRDPEDEVRLFAYTLLDRQEQQLTRQIAQLQQGLDAGAHGGQRQRLRRQRLDLQLELLHRDLAQGDWRQLLLAQALAQAHEALHETPNDATLHLQTGRLQQLAGDSEAARRHLERALALGAPPSRTHPYLAELALRRRDPAQARHWMAGLDPHALSPRLQALRRFWLPDHA